MYRSKETSGILGAENLSFESLTGNNGCSSCEVDGGGLRAGSPINPNPFFLLLTSLSVFRIIKLLARLLQRKRSICRWLRNLISAGHIAVGDVDERSIEDVAPDDLRKYTHVISLPESGLVLCPQTRRMA